MKKEFVKNIKLKYSFFLVSFFLLFNLNIINLEVFANQNHSHTDSCYFGDKHICEGNEENGGKCYSPIYEYHKHNGEPNKTYPNGCYTKPNYNYHKHTDSCIKYTKKECSHSVTTTSNKEDYVCPKCGKLSFYGKKEFVLCSKEQGLYAYLGKCKNEKCNYNGNAYSINDTTISFSHYYYENEYICGKNEITIDSVFYELNCGKTNSTIEKVTYKKTCGKENGSFYNLKGMRVVPQCSTTIVSIAPKTKTQIGTKPDFTLIVTYLDGHTGEKQATKADWNSNKPYDNQNIVLYFTGRTKTNGEVNTLTTTINFSTPKPTITPTIKPQVEEIKEIEILEEEIVENTPIITPTLTSTPNPIVIEKEENLGNINTKPIVSTNKEENTDRLNMEEMLIDDTAISLPNNSENKEERIDLEDEKEELLLYGENIEITKKETEATGKITNLLYILIISIALFVILLLLCLWLYKKGYLFKIMSLDLEEDYDLEYEYEQEHKNQKDYYEETKEINLANRLDNSNEENKKEVENILEDIKETKNKKKEQSLFGSIPQNIDEELEELDS